MNLSFTDLALISLIIALCLVIRYLRSPKFIKAAEEFDEAAAIEIVNQDAEDNGH